MATEAATEAATEVSAPPTEISAPSIQHQTIPVGLPEKRSGQAGDFDLLLFSKTRPPLAGSVHLGRFERPFNANTMDVISPS
ncbi:MAG: hypothetical protein IPO22_13535 [Anaerolineales bacterium]|nr:hypothetical protein [Anaerolineales bacterium]